MAKSRFVSILTSVRLLFAKPRGFVAAARRRSLSWIDERARPAALLPSTLAEARPLARRQVGAIFGAVLVGVASARALLT